MQRNSILLLFAALLLQSAVQMAAPLSAQAAQKTKDSYHNTVYLPYYRLAQNDSDVFDFSAYDPEPFGPSPRNDDEGQKPRFQEYLLKALASGRVTQINYFRVLPAKEGDEVRTAKGIVVSKKGDLDFAGFYAEHLHYLQKLRQIYKFRLVVCVAGGASRYLPVVHDKELRDVFAANIVELAKQWDLDGIDFDWEFPRSKKDTDAYIALINSVRSGLRKGKEVPENYRVSVAIARRQSALSKELFAAVDIVNFMSYDFIPRHSTIEDAREMVDYLSRRFAIPASKIFLGLPFYGRQIKTGRHGRAKTYERLAQEFDPVPEDDEVGNYYFNGPDMIRKKLRLAQERGLGGTMIWEIAQDSKDQRSLLKIFPR